MLERGLWTLDGNDPFAPVRADTKTQTGMRGLCVLSDPPFVVLAKETRAKGVAKWVDVRNLGCEQWQDIYSDIGDAPPVWDVDAPAKEEALLLAKWRAWALSGWLKEWYAAVAELNLGGLRHTAAAQAWHGWRYSDMEGPILVHANEAAINLERDSIHPGRNECHFIGRTDGPIYQIDATAFYPGIAIAEKLPSRLRGSSPCDYRRAAQLAHNGWSVIARGRVQTDRPLVPVRVGNAIIYPVGSFDATLCWPEWELLRRRGAITTITGCACYESATVCQQFMGRLWSYRRDCERKHARARARCVKRLMNSLIGKFAAWDWGWVDSPGVGIGQPYACWYGLDEETHTLQRWRSIGWHVQKEVCNGETPDSCPAIASWVYSAGRVRLHNWLTIAGGRNVYYCDTDGFFTNQQGFDALVAAQQMESSGPGSLRLYKIHAWLEVWGLKSYATPDGIVCSGISDGAVLTTDGGFEFWRPETVQDAVREKRAPNPTLKRYRIPDHRPYRHGIVGSDGWVSPHRLDDGAITYGSP